MKTICFVAESRISFNVVRCPILFIACFVLVLFTSNNVFAASKKPLRVKSSELEPIAFSRLVFRPQETPVVDVVPEEINVNIADELRKYGYNVVGYENLVFGIDESHQAKYQLGGTLSVLDCDRSTRRDHEICHMAIAWQLYDPNRKQVLYRTTTRAFYINRFGKEMSYRSFYSLISGNVKSLLSRHKFVASVKKKSNSNQENTLVSIGEFKTCNSKLSLPKDMNKAMNGTVLLKPGNGQASGVILTLDGLILTAYHVVEGHFEVDLTTRDGRTCKASVIRVDKTQDIALLSCPITFKSCLPISGALPTTGTEIFAIGSPGSHDLAFSVTKGVISGLRGIDGSQYLQTDASVNPGNSGGPILTKNGETVGIVSWKVVMEGFEGLGFATPIEVALPRLGIIPGKKTTISREPLSRDNGKTSYPVLDPADHIPAQVCVRKNNCYTSPNLMDAHLAQNKKK